MTNRVLETVPASAAATAITPIPATDALPASPSEQVVTARGESAARVAVVPWALRLLTFAVWLVALLWAMHDGLLRAYGDALSHELIARRITDNPHPGLAQLGTVWLPLPPLLLAPLVWIDALWHAGIAGALLGALYLQAAAGALYRTGLIIGGGAVAWVSALVFLANPNIVYLFVTPLTEAPAFACTCLCVAALAHVLDGLPRGETRPESLFAAGFFAACGLLCRYDNWLLAALAAGVLVAATLWWLRDRYAAVAVAITYLLVPCGAVVFWLLYNQMIFGDPLSFFRGAYSSARIVDDLAARGIIPTVNGVPVAEHHPLLALRTYLTATIEVTGIVPALLALGGCAFAFARIRRRTANLVYLVLLAPLMFYIIALTTSQSVIVTRAAQQNGLFNVRYGGMLAPLVALAIGGLAAAFGRHRRLGAILLVAVALASGIAQFFEPLGPVTIAEGRLQDGAANARASHAAARWFAAQPHDGLTLIDDALQPQSKILYVEGGRPMRDFLDSSDPAAWEAALVSPPASVTSIVTLGQASRDRPNDRVGRALLHDGQIPGFVRAFDNGEIVIFRRATEGAR